VPGAVVLRSDVIRKRLCDVPPLQRLGPAGYTPEVSARVYARVAAQAGLVVRGGHSVIADAVYARAADRQAIERVAAEASVPFIGVWLDAPDQTLFERTSRRGQDASDADAAVVRMQRAQDTGPIGWQRLDTGGLADLVLRKALAIVDDRVRHPLVAAGSEQHG
jgi:predicted kinase